MRRQGVCEEEPRERGDVETGAAKKRSRAFARRFTTVRPSYYGGMGRVSRSCSAAAAAAAACVVRLWARISHPPSTSRRAAPHPSLLHIWRLFHNEGRSYDWTGRQGFGSWIWIRGRRASVFCVEMYWYGRASHAPHPPPRFLAARRGAGGRQAPGLHVGGSCGAVGWGLARYRLSGMGGKLLGQESCPVWEHSTGQGRDCGWSAGQSASWPREGAGLTSSLGWEEYVKKRAFPFLGGRWGVSLYFTWSAGLWDRHGMGWYALIGSIAYFSRAVIAKASCVSLLNR